MPYLPTPGRQRRTCVDVSGTRCDLDHRTNSTLIAGNTHDVAAAYRLVTDLGAKTHLLIKFFSGGRGLTHLHDLDIDYAAWSRLLLDLTAARTRDELPRLLVSVPAPWEFYLPFLDAASDLAAAEKVWGYRSPLREPWYARTGSIGDPSGIVDLNIVGNGDVFPITLMSGSPAARCGNITRQPLHEIWNTAPVLARLRGMRTADLPGPCRACDLLAQCGGGSRARALISSGSLTGPDLACPRLAAAPPQTC